jgi:putative SOS response-associated peptidase YedK
LPSTFNARAETVAEKPMFRSAFKSRRCIIPVSGFYEWTGKPGSKTPHYFSARDGDPLAFAGLWESRRNPETLETVESATIIVGPANEWMRPYHDRTPVILDWRDADAWLLGDQAGDLLNRHLWMLCRSGSSRRGLTAPASATMKHHGSCGQ